MATDFWPRSTSWLVSRTGGAVSVGLSTARGRSVMGTGSFGGGLLNMRPPGPVDRVSRRHRLGDEADLAHTRALRSRHRQGHALVAHRLVAADVQFGLGILGRGAGEALLEVGVLYRGLVPEIGAVGVHR